MPGGGRAPSARGGACPQARPVGPAPGALLDPLDLRIVAALQIDGRASWGRIARALGESERTVARRASRLLQEGWVAVVGIVHKQLVGWGEPYLLRIGCEPRRLRAVARSLAAMPEIRWVSVVTGSTDCFVEMDVGRERLLPMVLDEVAALPGVTSLRTHAVLRYFKSSHEWRLDVLTAEETAALARTDLDPVASLAARPAEPTAEENAVLELLSLDGRATTDQIAAAAGISPSTAWRRIEALRARGMVFIRADAEASLLGMPVEAQLWLRVAPGRTTEVGTRLARCPQVHYLVATTGDCQLVADIALADRAALYTFLDEVTGAEEGIDQVDVTLTAQTPKRGFVRREDGRLTPVGSPVVGAGATARGARRERKNPGADHVADGAR
ncbi:Lrp/AsnC family transcriptional regulator [Streptomyces cavernicola]|uniref:Lrp/AsnC family transcriptional regulator n=1 Tax=Streptomyces cavernicola TaxID=3043613 RepID=A0ABT6S7U3_9ACTN|nr:Lrp/AsnC family transcriptional regulator [Streptomyces sp. B-S-A6]MDI3404085.1 Lrp/AsnC family transcriptional regulator [Streptomyces sp. B-S-A6]